MEMWVLDKDMLEADGSLHTEKQKLIYPGM